MVQYFKLHILLLCVTLLLLSVAQSKYGHENFYHLAGRVKSFHEFDSSVTWVNGKATITFNQQQLLVFDSTGGNTEVHKFDKHGVQNHYQKNSFDKRGNLIETDFYNVNNVLTSQTKSKHDSKGNISFQEVFNYTNFGNLETHALRYYDNKRRIWKEVIFTPSQQVTTHTVRHYGKKNAALATQKKARKQIDKYDAKGNLTVREIYNDDGVLRSHMEWEYNAAGQKTLSRQYQPDSTGLKLIDETFFEEHGRMLKGLTYKSGKLQTETINKFVLDPVGNWTVDSTFENETLTAIKRRTLEYY